MKNSVESSPMNAPAMGFILVALWAVLGFIVPLVWHTRYYATHTVEQIGGEVEWAVTLLVVLTIVATVGFAIDWMARGGCKKNTLQTILQVAMIEGWVVCLLGFLAG